MELIKLISDVKKKLGYVCLLWPTGEKTEITLDIAYYIGQKNISPGEYYMLVLFTLIIRTVQALRANISIRPFGAPLPRPLHCCYINIFFTWKGLRVNCVSVMLKNSQGGTNDGSGRLLTRSFVLWWCL